MSTICFCLFYDFLSPTYAHKCHIQTGRIRKSQGTHFFFFSDTESESLDTIIGEEINGLFNKVEEKVTLAAFEDVDADTELKLKQLMLKVNTFNLKI